jgi:hypothetical protein
MRKFALICIALLALTGCDTFVKASVATLAGARDFIGQAQANHKDECTAAPTKPFPCVAINQAVEAQNVAVSALETYCQVPVAPTPATLAAQGATACNPNPTAKQILVAALSNLGAIVAQYKSQSGGQP